MTNGSLGISNMFSRSNAIAGRTPANGRPSWNFCARSSAGRPRKSENQKRKTNAPRQRRFRARLREELEKGFEGFCGPTPHCPKRREMSRILPPESPASAPLMSSAKPLNTVHLATRSTQGTRRTTEPQKLGLWV